MRIHPAVSTKQAQEWLIQMAIASFGVRRTKELEDQTLPLAEAMAEVSAVELDESVDPAFA